MGGWKRRRTYVVVLVLAELDPGAKAVHAQVPIRAFCAWFFCLERWVGRWEKVYLCKRRDEVGGWVGGKEGEEEEGGGGGGGG